MTSSLPIVSDAAQASRGVEKITPVSPVQPASGGGSEGFPGALSNASRDRTAKPSGVPGNPDASQDEEGARAGLPTSAIPGRDTGKDLPDALTSSEAAELSLAAELEVDLEDQTGVAEALTISTRFVLESVRAEPGETGVKVDNLANTLLGKLGGEEGGSRRGELLVQTRLPEQSTALSLEAAGRSDADDVQLNRQLQQAQEARVANAARSEVTVPQKVGTPEWGEAMAGRISILVNQRLSSARIHLNPAELGPVEVRVNMNNEQASVQFISHSAQVRDALEQSIPRLREMLENAGFALADSHVGDEGRGQPDDEDKPAGRLLDEGDEPTPVVAEKTVGLIDERV